jgi:hypothetical protein
MGAIVVVDYWLGGTSDITRDDLNKVIEILEIADPQHKLPIGDNCTYRLVLELADQLIPKAEETQKKKKTQKTKKTKKKKKKKKTKKKKP